MMNVAAATRTATATATATAMMTDSYELPARLPLLRPAAAHTPADTFVCRLVESLSWTFGLDASGEAVARQLLFGRPLGDIAQALGVSNSEAQRMCRALFVAVGADGRQMLFETALRLTTARELGRHFAAAA